MHAITLRYNYLFRSTKGLALVAIAMIALVTAFFGMISGPMAEFGIRDVVIRATGMSIVEAEREGRIIMLYHSIAMAVVAIEVYFITNMVPMKKSQQSSINATVTLGYLFTMIFGLWFAYFGHNFVAHGLFIFGNSLMFFGGLLLAVALWPWRKQHYVKDPQYSHSKKGIDLERVAFFTMAVAYPGFFHFWGCGRRQFGHDVRDLPGRRHHPSSRKDDSAEIDNRPFAHHVDPHRHRHNADRRPLARFQGCVAQDRYAADDRRHDRHFRGRLVGCAD